MTIPKKHDTHRPHRHDLTIKRVREKIFTMMNKKLIFTAFILILLVMSGCKSHLTFDETLLIGRWQRTSTLTGGLDCYRYDAGGTGVTWDTGDDVTEDEGQAFDWTLSNDVLTLVHKGAMGELIPKTYTMQKLNTTTLSYSDDYGVTYTFSRM